MIKVPWTQHQVDALNRLQNMHHFHGYTCPDHSDTNLTATVDGWACGKCDYKQDWAFEQSVEFGAHLIELDKREARERSEG